MDDSHAEVKYISLDEYIRNISSDAENLVEHQLREGGVHDHQRIIYRIMQNMVGQRKRWR